MIVLLSQKRFKDKHGAQIDGLDSAYLDFFINNDVFPAQAVFVPVPNQLIDLRSLVKTCVPDLIILTGGNNINPLSFGSDVRLDGLSPKRDEVEKALLDFALAKGIPVIGICRGFHFINVYLGGKLTLNLSNHRPGKDHSCQFDGKKYNINSYHNHGIAPDDLAKELRPIGKTIDGKLIEAFAGPQILGVQWHPERPGADKELFRLLVNEFIKL